jgi:N-acetyl sugar amidotransferase
MTSDTSQYIPKNSVTRSFDKVRYCTRCVEPNTRPGAEFDEEGVCRPCRYADQVVEIDWDARRQELQEIVTWARANGSSGYDCVIGVSGGKDSMRQAFFVRDELNLKPLLVCCSYPPEQVAERGSDNLKNLAEQGFDVHLVSPAPQNWKNMMRMGFMEFGQWTRSTELTLYSTMPRAAIAFQIPLIFLGENPALTFGAKAGSLNGSANDLHQYDTLNGARLDPWLERGVRRSKLYWYNFPNERDIKRAGLRMVYLGYYMSDFNDTENGRFAVDHGMIPRTGADADPAETGSLNPFESVDEDFVHVNQFLKYLKLGFGKITQQASVKVRQGELTRDDALELVRQYDGRCSDSLINHFCRYLEIDQEEFWKIAENVRNHDLWQMNNHGEWELRRKPE